MLFGLSGLTDGGLPPKDQTHYASRGPAMRLYFYGKLANSIAPQLEFNAETPCSVGGLRRQLMADYPEATDTLQDERAKALVKETVVANDYILTEDDEVEFLSPVSGG